MKALVIGICLAAFGLGCDRGSDRMPAREVYNDGISDLEAKQWADAQKKLLEARNEAGHDPELRYRAAYNLGVAFARHADTIEDKKPKEKLRLLRQARDWFRDAVRLRPTDDDARYNIDVIERRIQIVTDQMLRAENTLEKKLQRIISDQRGLRDGVRQLMTRIAASGSKAEPIGFAGEFRSLAKMERVLLGDAGDLVDLAGSDIDRIQDIDEKQRSPQDQVRLVQMKNFEQYINRARLGLSGARRVLRRLQAEKAHERADAALADLKRAAEQLMDPVTVLKNIAREQVGLARHTGALAKLATGTLKLEGGKVAKAPPWLTTTHLAERQVRLKERADELAQRFAGANREPTAEEAKKMNPQQKQLMAQARDAHPFVVAAVTEMGSAIQALGAGQSGATRASEAQGRALMALARAIEAFSDIRGLVNLAYATQEQIMGLLSPAEKAPTKEPMSTAERAKELGKLTGDNVGRMKRLEGLIATALGAAKQTLDQAGAADPKDPNAAQAKKSAEQQAQLYVQAEVLRKQAAEALGKLDAIIGNIGKRRGAKSGKPIDVAAEGKKHLEELRKLFFGIVEHLEQLVRDQSETRDGTATAHAADDDKRKVLLGPLADAQQKHAQMGPALADALSKQADALSQKGDEKSVAQADKMGKAVKELEVANDEMSAASGSLTEARDATISYDMQPILDAQAKALEHLQEALRLLKPPKKNEGDNKKQNQQQQQQQQDEVSQQQANRRLQAVREREAQRRRKQKDRGRNKPEPVEKDW